MLRLDWSFAYSSQRMPVMARNIVATSQPLAAQAGLQILRRGGNAIDAALAAAITLTVVEPTSNGIGSDAFALVWCDGRLHGLNASGRAPAAWTPGRFADERTMPQVGWESVTVPGAVSAWVALSRRFGRLPFEMLFDAAIEYASEGFLVSPLTAQAWRHAAERLDRFPEFARTFLPAGRAPEPGELFVNPAQAETLASIAGSGGASFYDGRLAERIVDDARVHNAAMTAADLAEHAPEWTEPIGMEYRGLTLHELPPNSQGLAALLALGILAHHSLADVPVDSAESIHLQIEAMKLALADVHRHVGEPAAMPVDAHAFLAADYIRQRAALLNVDAAGDPGHGVPPHESTVYLATADEGGRMVSFIQSNFEGFGSGIVIPATGIAMQNRGSGFTLEPGHSNEVGGGKRPYHTIIPAFVTRTPADTSAASEPVMAFGVMGGPMQPQGHVQVMIRLTDHGQNPQAALDAPRWRVEGGRRVVIEPGFPASTVAGLRDRGHEVEVADERTVRHGGGQAILRLPDGYLGASDARRDGQAVGW